MHTDGGNISIHCVGKHGIWRYKGAWFLHSVASEVSWRLAEEHLLMDQNRGGQLLVDCNFALREMLQYRACGSQFQAAGEPFQCLWITAFARGRALSSICNAVFQVANSKRRVYPDHFVLGLFVLNNRSANSAFGLSHRF